MPVHHRRRAIVFLTGEQVRDAFNQAAREGLVGTSVDWDRIADHLNARLERAPLAGKHRRPAEAQS